MRELAVRAELSAPVQAKRCRRLPKFKRCREKAPGPCQILRRFITRTRIARQKLLPRCHCRGHRTPALQWACPPHCSEAKEVAAIKAQEWAAVEARTLWQAKAAWESWASFEM